MNIHDLDLETDFLESFLTGGGAVQECDCGREHVAINSDYFDYPEDECTVFDYKHRAETDEMLVLHDDFDYIGCIEIDRKVWADCCECRGWEPYMKFIINHRHSIRDFLVRTSARVEVALEHEKTFRILKDKRL